MFLPSNSPHRILRGVASGLDPEPALRHLRIGAEQFVHLGVRPEIEGPLGLWRIGSRRLRGQAVGVLRGIEGPLRARHVPTHVLDGVLGHLQQRAGPGRLSRLQAGQDELRLVVEHLLEVRNPPRGVDRVAVKAAADVIAHPPARHRLQGGDRDAARVDVAAASRLAEQEQQLGRPGELRRSAEAAVSRVEGGRELLHARGERVDPGHSGGNGTARGPGNGSRGTSAGRRLHPAQPLEQRVGRLQQLAAAGGPALGHLPQHVGKSRPPPAGIRRKVGAAEERLQLRRQPDAHGPAAGPGRRLHERHVDAVDVGALLPVHLDRHEVLVEQRGDARVLERLVLHDVAPMAGRVADRQEDRLVLAPRTLERLVAPGIPVHRVAGVLLQVGTRLTGETIAQIAHTQRVATSYAAKTASRLTSTARRDCACTMNSRSNGSRWCWGKATEAIMSST